MLKRAVVAVRGGAVLTAAFRRLCVETDEPSSAPDISDQPPSGGCVLKLHLQEQRIKQQTSRLQAAVC